MRGKAVEPTVGGSHGAVWGFYVGSQKDAFTHVDRAGRIGGVRADCMMGVVIVKSAENDFLGVGLAVLKGIIVSYFGIVLITFLVPSKSPLIAESKLAPFIVSSYQTMVSVISPGSYEKWKNKLLMESRDWQGTAQGKSKGSPSKDGSR